MEEHYPLSSEKTSTKFILDALKEQEIEIEVEECFEPIVIPEGKMYFRTQEAIEILGIEVATLRRWEEEHRRHLRPEKSSKGHRVYRRKDLEFLRDLLQGKGSPSKKIDNQALQNAVLELKEFVANFTLAAV